MGEFTVQLSRDSHRRRQADAARSYRAAVGRFQGFGRLWFYTFVLHVPEGTELHSETASRCARALVAQVFGTVPARWKLELGRNGELHVHAVAPLPPCAVHEYADARPVYDVRRLLAYLSKPADARMCRHKLCTWTPDEGTRRREMFQAIDEQAAARRERLGRGKRRLPPVTGWTGRVTKLALWHTARRSLHCAALVLALALSLAVMPSPSSGPTFSSRPPRLTRSRPAQRRPRARAPDRPTCGLRV